MTKIELLKLIANGQDINTLKKNYGEVQISKLFSEIQEIIVNSENSENKNAKFEIFIDGSSIGNPGPAGIGIVIKKNGKNIKQISEFIGEATNNIAEYKALIKALELALEYNMKNLSVFTDSTLIVNQMINKFKVKNVDMRVHYLQAKELSNQIEEFTISYIPRDKNKEANILSNNGSKFGV